MSASKCVIYQLLAPAPLSCFRLKYSVFDRLTPLSLSPSIWLQLSARCRPILQPLVHTRNTLFAAIVAILSTNI
jgi:hypothetical protein